MAQAASTLPQELIEELYTQASIGYEHFVAQVTEAQKAATLEQGRKYKEEPEYAAAEMAKATGLLQQADADGDGLLSKAEYLNLMELFKQGAIENGTWVDDDMEHHGRTWDIANKINTEVDGVSFADFWTAVGTMMKKSAELKAASDAAAAQ